MKFLIKIIVNAITVLALSELLAGIQVSDTKAIIVVAFVLVVLNTFLRPFLIFITFPITILTLGLFILVINAIIVMLADSLIQGFHVENFWWALLFGLILSIINGIIHSDDKKKN